MTLQRPREREPLAEELKRYVRFSDDDARLLAGVRDAVSPAFRRVAEEFYDRIREHEDAHAVFTSEEQIQRLQRSLVTWQERVFGGTYDAEYFAKTSQVGAVHVRIGLPQRYVVMAMTLIRSALSALITSAETREALVRLLDIELAIMLESYRTDALARLERASSLDASLLDDVTNLTPAAIVALDDKGAIALFNAAAETLTGWARDEVLGKRFVDLMIVEEERDQAAALYSHDGRFEIELRTRSGKTLLTRWRVAAHAGNGVIAVGDDVTNEIEEREKGERESRLRAAGTLVAGLAHAIRNPLNGAGLHLALVERQASKGGEAETLDAVRVAASELRRLGALVTTFVEFARPAPIARTSIDLRKICERAVERARRETSNVAIETDLPREALMLDADGPRLELVLTHLIENAVDAGGSVVVRARREPHHAWVEVEDTGPGLSDPNAPIFDAFYSTKPDGTGLGLAIVHRVVAEHDGDVDVESRPGCTRFRLTLPLKGKST